MFEKSRIFKSKLSKKWRKVYFLGVGAAVFSLIAPLTSVALQGNTTSAPFSLLTRFLSDRDSLSALLANKRDELSNRAKRSESYLEFTKAAERFSASDWLDTIAMTRRIEDLAMDDELKYYLYENYLDKLWFAKNSKKISDSEQVVDTSDRLIAEEGSSGIWGMGGGGSYYYNLDSIQKSKMVIKDPWYESERQLNLNYLLLEDDGSNWPNSIIKGEYASSSKLIRDWEDKQVNRGIYDQLYFTEYPEFRSSIPSYHASLVESGLFKTTTGLTNRLSQWRSLKKMNPMKAINKRLMFKNKITSEIQSIYLNYNVSIGSANKASSGVLTIIVDNPKQMISSKKTMDETRVRTPYDTPTDIYLPSVFGVPVDFFDINLSTAKRSELYIDNAFILSTIRPVVANATKPNGVNESYTNVSNALEDFKGIEKEIAIYIFSKLNGYKIEHTPNSLREEEIDKNYLHFVSSEGHYSYFTDENDQRVVKNGATSKSPRKEMHTFLPDKAWIDWSNDMIFDESYKLLLNHLKSVVEKENNDQLYSKIQAAFTQAEVIRLLVPQQTLDLFGISNNFWDKLGNVASIASYLYTFVNVLQNVNLNPKNIDETFDTLTEVFVRMALPTTLLTLSLLGWVFPVGIIIGIASLLLDIIPSGNGHSIFDNFNDAGLNDWDFQMKNNFKNMLGTARNWSENYHKGVTWHIIDSWWERPELFIKAQDDPDSSYQHLSPGESFNWGNKIALWQKP